jgi:hypothetical protein
MKKKAGMIREPNKSEGTCTSLTTFQNLASGKRRGRSKQQSWAKNI